MLGTIQRHSVTTTGVSDRYLTPVGRKVDRELLMYY